MQQPGHLKQIEAEMPTGLGRVRLIREFWSAPIDVSGEADEHHLELALLPRATNQQGCFPDHWGPHRFEPIGQLFLLPAQHRVHCRSDCRRQDSIVFNFAPADVATWFDGELQWTHGRLRRSLDIVSPGIRSLLLRIGEEIRTPGFASDAMVELLSAQIAIELSRHLSDIDVNKATGGLATWHLRRIDERLSETGTPPSLTELASLCKLSVRHLTRAFRSSRGCSIGSYIAERRTDQARRLLASGMSVKAVAYTTGFTCPSNFATAFQRATGQTPREYRQKTEGNNASTKLLKAH
jgi:AraC family transcriptional regulator